jgi:hypothetical protein
MNDTELLIKIRTALEAGGIDSAKAKLEELSQTAVKASAGNAANAVTLDKSRREMESAARAAFALRQAAAGSTEGLRGLSGAAFQVGERMGMLVGKLSMVFAAFSAGWAIGTVIRKHLIDPLIETESKVDKVGARVKASAEQFRALNASNLDALNTRLSSMIQSVEKLNARMQQAFGQDWAVADAETETAITKVTAEMPEGPDRDKTIAGIRRDAAVRRFSDENQRSISAIQNAESAKASATIDAGSAQNTRDSADEKYRRAALDAGLKFGEGSREYIQAVGVYRQALEDAESALKAARDKETQVIEESNAIIREETAKRKVARSKVETAELQYSAEINRIDKDSAEKAAAAQARQEEELRQARLETLRRQFEQEANPAALRDISDEMLRLQIAGVKDTNPKARELRWQELISESSDQLDRRRQQIAVGFAEGALGREQQELFARPGDKKEQQDVVRAERDLENAKSGNRETITRLLNLIASMQADQKAIEQRLGNMEKREQVASGLN